MPLLAALVLAAALPAVQVRTHTGQTYDLPRPVTGPRGRIVEFREAPLARRRISAASAGSYRTTFDRFRTDLAEVSPQYGKQAVNGGVRDELFRTFHGVTVTLGDAEAAAVRRLPYVKAVHDDRPVKAFSSHEDTTRIERIRADRVWSELHTRGEGVRVAVIDTGVDSTHPALVGKVVPGYDFVDGDLDPMDTHGHGTHVAGIIAGATEDVRGVAPGVQIVAYRVLGPDGQGFASDVMLAIEHAVDPDRDGDFSDRIEILNLSLGSHLGDADDPGSRAVDAAVLAGSLVIVAAGNQGMSQSIGSPASARLALTVGNSDRNDRIDFSSSYGPTFPDLDPKPEIVAPGTDIRSAALGGGSLLATGTSMAAPHVSGAAALLLALYPGMSPDDMKGALTASAELMFDDPMQQGAGRLDAYGAAMMHSTIAPALVSIGRSPSNLDWTATRTVRITNRGTAARTYTAKIVAPAQVTISVEPASFTLDAGSSRDVVMTTNVGAGVEASLMTMAFGGRVDFESVDSPPVRVAWTGLRAARSTVTFTGGGLFPSVAWSCPGPNAFFTQNRATGHEALLPYAKCAVIVFTDGELREPVLIVQPHDITGDVSLDLSLADATHTVQLGGVDAEGQWIAGGGAAEGAVYFGHFFVDLTGLAFQSFAILYASSSTLRISSLPPEHTITAGEVLLDPSRGRIVSANYPVLRGLRSSIVLTAPPSALRRAHVQVAAQRDAALSGMVIVRGPFGQEFQGGGGMPVSLGDGWRGEVFVHEDVADHAVGVALMTSHPVTGQLDMTTPMFRAIDGRIFLSNDRIPSPDSYSVPEGGTLLLRKRPLVPKTLVDRYFDTSLYMLFGFGGMAGELYAAPARGAGLTIRDGGGNILEQGTVTNFLIRPQFGRAAYLIDLDVPGAHVSLSFDLNRNDFNPPLLNTLRIEDGSILLAVGDWRRAGITEETGNGRLTSLAWRGADGIWRDLPVTTVTEDLGTYAQLGHFPSGRLYRTPFLPTGGDVDLKVEMEDTAGNRSVITLDDVFGVGVTRRRAVGK